MIAVGSLYLLLAAIGRFAEAIGAVRCPCAPDCWCKKPGLSTFRWVAPFGHRSPGHAEDGAGHPATA
ncbi:MAG: hypothetical protein DLM58_10675 [Pseudonocardiales bacterium]|nr:MAG: hypothetical protein DLM58_10675 [Pseudonocardiales bacterium]